ncbi:MAG: TlpA disulfide reductase family protein [Ilumatobacteraceae bacterium]
MRRSIVKVATAIVLLLAACGSPSGDGAGERLPDVPIERLDGSATISLSDIRGPAVVNLWATWCAPCRREIPDFEAVHRARGDEVAFVGINIGEDAERASEFLDGIGVSYDQFLDDRGEVVTALRTTAMPVTIVVGSDGRVSTRHLGPMDQDDLNRAIDRAIADTDTGSAIVDRG